ncbi:hypothetical protein OG909_19030 [Streptomyces sp. NBC_01754]|uniref:hypothetical protein n=1 Tax=Streptomyces sp. NBC_01754 TaxID=2975930 RepID=UPI002DDBAC03|nr:hypothetical protein [Streptomyces sp. NBC_01754]WSC94191.1 hypothetical protein OG909_19030 [Streptomyces sp. NBC_01754]
MIRNVLGSVLALLGAAAAVQSPFRDWYDSHLGRDYRIQDLFGGISSTSSAVMTSVLLPFLFAALVALAGVLLRIRWVVAVAGLIVLGFTVLWMVRVGQHAGSLSVGGDGAGLRDGVAQALAGGVALLLGALLMSGRARGVRRRTADPYPVPADDRPDTWPPTQEPGPSTQTSPVPEPEPEPYTGPGRHRGPASDEDTAEHPVQDTPDPAQDVRNVRNVQDTAPDGDEQYRPPHP